MSDNQLKEEIIQILNWETVFFENVNDLSEKGIQAAHEKYSTEMIQRMNRVRNILLRDQEEEEGDRAKTSRLLDMLNTLVQNLIDENEVLKRTGGQP